MLYVTTRNDRDAYTAQRALRENRSPDGGMYLPFHMPSFSGAEVAELLDQPPNCCMAQVLNLLLQSKLTGWDLDFTVGRRPLRQRPLGRRTVMGETWHNPGFRFDRLVTDLTAKISQTETEQPGNWAKIAVRIAALFGLFAALGRESLGDGADVAMVSGDFSGPISAWYARQWGLPIGTIICCCNENNTLWELIYHGQLRTDAVSIATDLPEADVALPENLERLIRGCGGVDEVKRYVDACRRGKAYCPGEPVLSKLREGLVVSVVSSQRIESIVRNVQRSYGCAIASDAALAYGGLMDYRAKGGAYRLCMVLGEKAPEI